MFNRLNRMHIGSAQIKNVDNHVRKKKIENKIIRSSSSNLASPVVLVKKKDSMETRFCIDYMKSNYVTLKDSFPLPNMEETLAQFHIAVFYTTVDLRLGYHQIRLEEPSKPLTAFITHNGLFEFNT